MARKNFATEEFLSHVKYGCPYVIIGLLNTMYLLTEWEGRTGKYLARGQDVRTERSEVRAS